MTGSLRQERRRVAKLAQRVGDDRAALLSQGRLLRKRIGARLATPGGLLVCFAAGVALAPIAGAALRLALGARNVRRAAVDSARLYRSFSPRGATRPATPAGTRTRP